MTGLRSRTGNGSESSTVTCTAVHPVTRPAVVGLSLTVARHLARQMDGEITYRRTTDRHNVFELRLPSEHYAPVELDLVPA